MVRIRCLFVYFMGVLGLLLLRPIPMLAQNNSSASVQTAGDSLSEQSKMLDSDKESPSKRLENTNKSAQLVRIVSLNPAITEIVFALGAGDLLVGTTEYSNFPEEAKKLPRVGDYLRPNIERIVALKPDLVLASPEGVDAISGRLKKLNLQWESLPLRRLDDFPKTADRLGALLSRPSAAKKIVEKWRADLAELRVEAPSLQALIQVDHDPLVVAGEDSFLAEALAACGLKAQPEGSRGYQRLSSEMLLKQPLQVIVVTAHTKRPGFQAEVASFWKQRAGTYNPKIIWGDPDGLSRLTPKFLGHAKEVCREARQ